MRAIHAIAGGLLLGGGLGWWALGHPGYETDAQRQARMVAAREAATPKLYRWHDANGVLQLTSTPPKGRKYERVEMREDVNVVPMSPPAPSAKKPVKH
jgi:hypothetical protein